MTKSTHGDRLAMAAAELQTAEDAAAELAARLEAIEADAAAARANLAADLQNVPLNELQKAAERQADARIRLEAAEATAAELRRRIGRQDGEVRRARARYGAVLVETKQADLDRQSRAIVELLQQALGLLEAQRRDEMALYDAASVTPVVRFGPAFAETIRHKLEFVRKELDQ